MNTGIQDGYNLAWKLAQVIKHGASAELLETYNEERLPNARRLLNTTDRIFDFAASDEWLISFLRKNVFPYIANLALSFDSVRQFFFPIVSQIGIAYEESSLSETRGVFDVKAGSRMPWFEIDGKDIYEFLREPLFHLVVFSNDRETMPSVPNATIDKWSGRMDTHFFPMSDVVRERFGREDAFYLVLRPDNYIGLISDDFSPEAVRTYLEKFS